jgi:hypothetical protein
MPGELRAATTRNGAASGPVVHGAGVGGACPVSAKAEERKHGYHDHDQTDDVDDGIHAKTPLG